MMIDISKHFSTTQAAFKSLELDGAAKLAEKMNNYTNIHAKLLNEVTKHQRIMENLEKNFNPFGGVFNEIMESHNRQMKYFEQISSPIHTSLNSIHKATEQLCRPIETKMHMIRKAAEPALSIQNAFNDLLQEQNRVEILMEPLATAQKIALQFKSHADVLQAYGYADPLKKIIDAFPVDLLVYIQLSSGLWIIKDKEILNYMLENYSSSFDHEEYICKYYSADGWKKLRVMVEEWGECTPIKQRYPALKGCFICVKSAQEENISFVASAVIPALIINIEGVRKDILEIVDESNGKYLNKKCKKARDYREKMLKRTTEDHLPESIASTSHKAIQVLFKNYHELAKEKMEDSNTTKLNRHKILHGDRFFLDYGTMGNLVWLFLCLDILIQIRLGVYKKYGQ